MKERGKNSIQLNGGVSGIAGSFVGFSYSTNNFLGLGETLSLSTQLGTVQRSAQLGSPSRTCSIMPLQVGFTVFTSRFDYNQARQASILAGTNLTPLYNQLGTQNLLNYVSNSKGFTAFASYPLRRSFARVGLSYGYTIQNVKTLTDAADDVFQLHQLPAHQRAEFAERHHVLDHHSELHLQLGEPSHHADRREGLSLSVQFAGSILGGNVNQIEPVLDAKYFHKSPLNPKHVIGVARAGQVADRIWRQSGAAVQPLLYGRRKRYPRIRHLGHQPDRVCADLEQSVNVLNNDGTPRMQKGSDRQRRIDVLST